eukprot:scaffold6374_cov121-Cylindrotheca_fusiformis.AAC.10
MSSAAYAYDDDDEYLIDGEESFADYIPTAYQPGWSWTYYIIAVCVALNFVLPILLCLARRRDERERKEKEAKTPATTAPDVNKEEPLDESGNAFSQVAANVLDQKVSKAIVHRQTTRKRRSRRTIKNEMDAAELEKDELSDAEDDNHSLKQSPTDYPLTLGEQVVDASTWDKEMKKIVSLWIPYSISGAADGLSQIVNFAIISHFIGVKEGNAYVTIVILTEFTDVFTIGFAEAIEVLGPQADGARNNLLVGRYMQLGFIFYTLASIPGIIIWSIYTEDAVQWFGFDEETAKLAQGYAYPLLAMCLFEGAGEVLDAYLEFMDHEKFVMVMTILAAVAESLVVIIMAVAGWKDLVFVGVVQAMVSFLIMISIICYVLYKGWLDDVWDGIALTWGLGDKQAVKNIVNTAIPMGISYLLTYGEWEIMTLFAAHMGPAEVAAWGILGFLWDTFEYAIGTWRRPIILFSGHGLADAAEVRVAFRMGSGETQQARASAAKGMYLGVVASVYATALLFLISGNLPQWLTPDPTLQRMVFETLPLVGFGQVLMSVGMVSWNIVEGQGRVRLATLVEFVSSWFFVMPAAAVLVFVFDYNLLGMVGPLVVGYTIGCVAITYILIRSDWESLSTKVIAINGGTLNFDEYDWDDLPLRIQKAAQVLGYTEEMWDNDTEPPAAHKSWSRLSSQEKEAAKKLGFNKQKWDSDGSGATDDEGRSLSTNYDDFDWHELPVAVQQAAIVLGYNQSLWDGDKDPKSCDKDWADLSREEQAAALKLGYDQMKWDGHSDSDSASASSGLYDKYDWKDLPLDAKKATKVLGYTASMWDDNKESPVCQKPWGKLSTAERTAAKILGYDETSWNPQTKAASTSLPVSSSSSQQFYDFDWNDLPEDVKEAARGLGYTPKSWDTNVEPKSCEKDWKDLSAVEQTLAKKLGYNQLTWDDNGDSPSCIKYDDLTWRKLPVEVQKAATVLGYTAKMWNNDQEPASCDKDWKELTSEERRAALVLGYDKKQWEGGSPSKNYDELTWRKLPVEAQEAAKVLGYTPKMWNNDQEPATCDKDWKELSSEERKAAFVLGYDKKQWESESPNKNYDDLTWRKLPPEAQEAAKVLGYTPKMWNNDQEPASCCKDWKELSKTEREAARKLGYSESNWEANL